MQFYIGNYKLNNWLYRDNNQIGDFRIDNFILLFYFSYLIIALLGYSFINYIQINPVTLFFYLVYVLFLYLGAFIGLRIRLRLKISKIEIRDEKVFIKTWLIIFSIVISLIWYTLIKEYGSLGLILANAYNIRANTIGQSISIVPLWLTYLGSIVYAFFAILLIINHKTKKYLFAVIYIFIVILLSDLQTFGRIGILFAIFTVLGSLIYTKQKFTTIKNFFLSFILYNLLMLPRLIRGSFDNFSGTINNYAPYFTIKIIPYFYGITSIYIYYFSSIFSFNQLLNIEVDHSLGNKNFAPIINIFRRLFPSLSIDRIQLIEPSSNIPFEYNIYSILGDIYLDFGYIGFFILPLFFGFTIGLIFRNKGLFIDSLKLMMLAWIFYSPIYNCFSFGGFFFSFCFLVILSIFFKESKIYYEKH